MVSILPFRICNNCYSNGYFHIIDGAKTKKQREMHTMLNRWGTPDDLLGPCIFLSSDASRYITGQDIYVDGGWLSNGLIE